jgi:hypothetical protein
MKKSYFSLAKKSFFALGVTVVALGGTAAVSAQSTANTVINANLGSTISITTSGTVALPITPTIGGSQTTAADTVTVATNNTSGYTLSIRDSDTNTSLANGANEISSHAGTVALPTTLASNAWGFRIDGQGGFGAGPTSGSVDQATNASLFAGVTSADVVVKTTAAPAAGDVTSVFFSAKADTSLPNGTYTGTVVYTATTN